MSKNVLRLYDTVNLITVESDETIKLPQVDEITCRENLDRSKEYGRNICALSNCSLYGKVHPSETDVSIVVGCREEADCDGEAVRRSKDHLHEALAAHPAVDI